MPSSGDVGVAAAGSRRARRPRAAAGAEQRRAGAGGDRPGLGGGDRGRVGGGVLLGEGEELEVGEQVERVVGAGAVGAEADRDPGRARRRVGEDAADRELHVGDRVGDDGGAALGDQLQLLAGRARRRGRARCARSAARAGRGRRRGARRGRRGSRSTSCSVSERWIWTGSSRSAASSAIQRSELLADRVDRVRGEGGRDRRRRARRARSRLAQRRRAASPRRRRRRRTAAPPIVARRPASATARAVASGCQYMSQKRVVPVRIISTQASRVPQ